MKQRLVALILLVDATSACAPPTEHLGVFGFVWGLARYAVDTAWYGGGIGTQARTCETAADPTENTFSIWGTIYAQQTAMLLLTSDGLNGHERRALDEAYAAERDWLRGFEAAATTRNADSVRAIAEAECHLRHASESACASSRVFTCCALTQHRTWLQVALLLSRVIERVYGPGACAAPRAPDAALPLFEDGVRALLDEALPDDGPENAALRARLAVLAWAYKGVCDARNGACPALGNATLAPAVIALGRQTELAFATDLACA
jgi:hypothetical protein